MLVACIVQNDFQRRVPIMFSKFFKKEHDSFRCDIGSIIKGEYFFCNGIYNSQDIDPVAPGLALGEMINKRLTHHKAQTKGSKMKCAASINNR